MRATLVVARGRSLYIVPPAERPREFRCEPRGRTGGIAPPAEPDLPPSLVAGLAGTDPAVPIVACGPSLAERLTAQVGRPIRTAGPAEWRSALEQLPPPEPAAEREEILRRARSDLEAALRSPEEVLVSLAREEERVERTVGREARAAEAFVAVPGTVLAEVARNGERARELLADHHRELVRRLEAEARQTVPNLSAVVGARTAARLVAAAGGLGALARMSSSRVQLLGSRRRPDPERGPRFGVIYLAEGSERIPQGRRGAYARSLASLAVVAVRADRFTHRDLAGPLQRRRDARRDDLMRRRR